jgi:hypothetical protein
MIDLRFSVAIEADHLFSWHLINTNSCSGDSQNFQRYPPPRPTELPGIFGAKYDASEDPYTSMFRDFVFPQRDDDMDE